MTNNTTAAEYLALAKRLAVECGKYALQEQRNQLHINEKTNAFDLVTHVDKENETYMRSAVAEVYPDHSFLGEEEGASGSGDVQWIVDPIDGTVNYAHRVPIWCVSIGVEVKGEIVCGAIYDPNRDELFYALKGEGAFCNDTRLRVSNISDPNRSLLVTGFPYNISENPNHSYERFIAFLRRGILVRRLGSAAIDLCYVAAGRFDGFFEGALSPWDTAAGTLLVREAGGTVTNYLGEEHSVNHKPIIASNGLLHSFMSEVIQSIKP